MKHLADVAFWRETGWKLAVAPVLAVALFTAVISFRSATANSVQQRICDRVDKLAQVQITSLDRALVTLPTLAYYRQNPGELKVALAAVKQQRADLQGVTCDGATAAFL